MALLSVVAGTASCDRSGEIVIVPEFDHSFSFESGLEGWEGRALSTDTAATWSVAVVQDRASAGSASARLDVTTATGGVRVWLERRFEVRPEQAYDVEIQFDLGTADPATGAWRVVAGAHGAPPQHEAELHIRDATAAAAPEDTVAFARRSYQTRATADAEGRLWVNLGVWATGPGERSYWVDAVRLIFTRAGG